MLRSLLVFLVMATLSLMAQRPNRPPAESFDRDLKRARPGTWLVLEDEGAAWGASLRTALSEEPLVELGLPVKVVSGGKSPDALAAMVRQRFGWSKGAHWALVDPSGRILAEASEPPTSANLAKAAEQAGIRTRVQELEDFLRRNPDHFEAQVALFRERVLVANRRTEKILGAAVEAPTGAQGVPPPPPRTLEEASDQKIWATAADQLGRLFQGSWREAGFELVMAITRARAQHSPAMVAVLSRHRSDIEDALHRSPSDSGVWLMWLTASRKAGGWALAPLLHSLQPIPGTPPEEWPPLMVLTEFVKEARERGDWTAVRETLEPRWDFMKGDLGGGGGRWLEGIILPLMEAYLSLGDSNAADQLLNEVNALAGWPGLATQAKNLATRMNHPDLAARWGALAPSGNSPSRPSR